MPAGLDAPASPCWSCATWRSAVLEPRRERLAREPEPAAAMHTHAQPTEQVVARPDLQPPLRRDRHREVERLVRCLALDLDLPARRAAR